MSDMIKKPGLMGSVSNFIKKEIKGEKPEEEGTWSNSTMDYVTKGGVTGGLVGAGLGAAAHYAAAEKETLTYKYEVPVIQNQKIGEIPSNHISATPDIGDPAFVNAQGKPVSGTGVNVFGNVAQKNLLGGFKMDEKTAEAHWKGSSLVSSIVGGAVIGVVGGALAGVCLKLLNSIIHPAHSEQPWQRSAPEAWKNSAPPEWKNSAGSQPWSRSAPAWSNSHNKAPWSDIHSRAPYSDVHNNYGNVHNNYGDMHHNVYNNSHSNYSNTHSNAHSNYSNTHSNASPSWDRHVSY